MYQGIEMNSQIVGVMQAIKLLDTTELGVFLDGLYVGLMEDLKKYQFILDYATYELEQTMTEEEIEIQEQKLEGSRTSWRRPRTAHELTLEEFFDQQENHVYVSA